MIGRARRLTLALLAATTTAGCIPARTTTAAEAPPTAAGEWPTAHAAALLEARESRLGLADRLLSDFAQRFPDSPEAAEVPYWRAVYKVDPANAAATREAATLLDAYLANAPNGLHRMEASALRRLITTLEARTVALAAQAAAPVVRTEEKVLQDEIVRLRDELAKANAELARIRRRLAQPKR